MIKDKIYVNYFVNITNISKINIRVVNQNPDESDNPDNADSDQEQSSDKDKGLSAGIIALIIIGSLIVVFAIAFVFVYMHY